MAAASSANPSSDAPVAAAGAASACVLALLKSATAVFAAAWSKQHNVADDGDDDAVATLAPAFDRSTAECGKRLRADLVAAVALDDVKDSDVHRHLMRSCVKVGHDVVLRLDRLETSAGGTATWDLIDLVVLGERLDSLIQRAHNLETTSL